MPTDEQLESSNAVKVMLVNTEDVSDHRIFIVRHPTSFKTLRRVQFDIELAAKRYGLPLA